MSYDLFYVGARKVQWAELMAWAKGWPQMSAIEDEHGHRLAYENPQTGVYASLWWGPQPDPVAAPEGLVDAELHFNLNYCRPSFFAHEAMPVAVALARHFELQVVDPQGGPGGAHIPTTQDLIERWKAGNRGAISATEAVLGQKRPTMDEAAALAYWRYKRALPKYRAEFDQEDPLDGYFVPDLNLFALPDGRAIRLAFLTAPTTYLVPPCDAFALRRNDQTVLVWAKTMEAALGHMIESDDDDFLDEEDIIDDPDQEPPDEDFDGLRFIGECALFEPGAMDAWEAFHATAKGEIPLDHLTRIQADGFVDA